MLFYDTFLFHQWSATTECFLTRVLSKFVKSYQKQLSDIYYSFPSFALTWLRMDEISVEYVIRKFIPTSPKEA